MEKMDNSILKDNLIKVSLFTPKKERMENASNQNLLPMVVVKKLPNEMTSKELKNIFDIYGDIMISGIINESPIFLAENPIRITTKIIEKKNKIIIIKMKT